MEEKHEGTPNPLNPKKEAEPVDEIVESVQTSEILESAQPDDTGTSTESIELAEPEIKESVAVSDEKAEKSYDLDDSGEAITINVQSKKEEEELIDPTEPLELSESDKSDESEKPVTPVETPKTIDAVHRPVRPIDAVKPTIAKPTDAIESTFASEQATSQANHSLDPMDTLGVVTDMNGMAVSTANLDPTNRPMQQAPIPEAPKPKKKKTGLIIGMIISLFIAVGCGVAAALLLMNHGEEDPVALAMNKLVTEGLPENIAIDGTIDVKVNNLTLPVSSLKITLNSEAVTKSLINSSVAVLDANMRSGGNVKLEIDEIYAANGDLYLKIDGVGEILNDPYIWEGEVNGDSTLEAIDGEWLRIAIDELGSTLPVEATGQNTLTCLAGLTNSVNNNINSLIGMYSKYPFITSSTQNIPIESRQNPIYRITINGDNMISFLQEAQKTTVAENFASCMGYKNSQLDINGIMAEVEKIPVLYVEVDNNHNFTRLYLTTEINEGDASAIIDLNLTYPNNVNVPEPVEYRDFADMWQELLLNTYEVEGAPGGQEGTESSTGTGEQTTTETGTPTGTNTTP